MSNKPKSLRKAPKIKPQNGPIYSKPSWTSTDTFVISGSQLEQMATLAGAFRPLIDMVDTVIRSGELSDTIKTDFVYADGVSVPDSDSRIAAMRAEHELEMSRMRKQVEEYQINMEKAQAEAKEAKEAKKPTKLEVVETPNSEVNADQDSVGATT